jgi:uncharacterized membrane protein (DUF4010 family)
LPSTALPDRSRHAIRTTVSRPIRTVRSEYPSTAVGTPSNPLELAAALIFALLFVVVSLAAAWVRTRFGEPSLYALAGVVGLTDIDPFVLSIAQGTGPPLSVNTAVAAILVAASSNKILKSAYTAGFAGARAAIAPAGALLLLALAGGGLAWRAASLP